MAYYPTLNSSLLQTVSASTMSYAKNAINNTTLKIGIVTNVYEVDAEENISKLVPEYDVSTIENDPNSSFNTNNYKNCVVMQLFGGLGDFFEYKLRPTEKSVETTEKGDLTDPTGGELVLLLCIDGATEKGIILGSLLNNGRKTVLTKENGVHLEGEYNGLNYKINKDGELLVTFKSASDNKGKYADEKAGGSNLGINKDGNITLQTSSEKDNEQIVLNKKDQNITMKARKNIELEATKEFKLTSKDKATVEIKELICKSEGAVQIKAGSAFKMESSSSLAIKGSSVKIEAQSNLEVKAMNINIKGQMIKIDAPMVMLGGAGGMPVLTAKTQFMGVCSAPGTPMISMPVPGTYSFKVYAA